jgi:hypothetical protein
MPPNNALESAAERPRTHLPVSRFAAAKRLPGKWAVQRERYAAWFIWGRIEWLGPR